MNIAQRAAQIWPLLMLAATNRQVLTYGQVAWMIGVPAAGLGSLLEPIQSYCMVKGLPPLTVLVVGKDTGLPGSGFSGAADIPAAQARVFAYEWPKLQAPGPEELAAALKSHPSKGLPAT